MKTLALAAALVAATSTAALAGEHRLHTLQFFHGADGASPQSALIPDGAGSYYGATVSGGGADLGTVFRLAADGSVTTLHEFRAGHGAAHPSGQLVLLSDGSVAGAGDRADGKDGAVIFKLSPSGRETVLHRFGKHDPAGLGLTGGVAKGADDSLYGVTASGGRYGCGTLFHLTETGAVEVLHDFAGFANNDGCTPEFTVPLLDAQGSLYGVTRMGGFSGWGVIYRRAADGTYSILHNFTNFPDQGDGAGPTGPLLRDAQGNLYGTTEYGDVTIAGGGAVWRLAPDGGFRLLHAFSGLVGDQDGIDPLGGVTEDADGNLYGTTRQGGQANFGTVFKIAPNGRARVLHWFDILDGTDPVAGPTLDGQGNLLGTTMLCGVDDGSCGKGTVYRLTRK
ncbi:MAG TPA: choice-of-anchor tandem repeat GloVer-containing protein [Rhizomicrobium sp.]|nr:choice-of-anchor tandem repeat GloVer-containing protein [Rhizomicrobium sp.]